jgi:hypothetical protein
LPLNGYRTNCYAKVSDQRFEIIHGEWFEILWSNSDSALGREWKGGTTFASLWGSWKDDCG